MLLKLFWFFLRLAAISFGGGYPMMGIIQSEGGKIVGLTAGEFADLAALELLASGPIVINAATYIGYIKADILGALVSTLAVTIPSFVYTTIVYYFLTKFKDNKYIESFLEAIKIACGGILITTALNIGKDLFFLEGNIKLALENPNNIIWQGILIFVLCFVGNFKLKINPIYIIFASGILGVILF